MCVNLNNFVKPNEYFLSSHLQQRTPVAEWCRKGQRSNWPYGPLRMPRGTGFFGIRHRAIPRFIAFYFAFSCVVVLVWLDTTSTQRFQHVHYSTRFRFGFGAIWATTTVKDTHTGYQPSEGFQFYAGGCINPSQTLRLLWKI